MWKMRRIPLTTVAVAALLLCCTPTEPCACPPALGHGVVYGVVTRAAGEPAAGAVVRVEAFHRGCADSLGSMLVDRPTAPVDGSGRYRYAMRSMVPSDTACLRLAALDTAGAREDSSVIAGIRMRLRSRAPYDSLRVDFALP